MFYQYNNWIFEYVHRFWNFCFLKILSMADKSRIDVGCLSSIISHKLFRKILLPLKNPKNSRLPLELESNILSRLPVQSLSRFRCVCKRWRDEINHPNFITSHTTRIQSQENSTTFVITTTVTLLVLVTACFASETYIILTVY